MEHEQERREQVEQYEFRAMALAGNVIEELNKLGADGWMAVQQMGQNAEGAIFLVQRRKRALVIAGPRDVPLI